MQLDRYLIRGEIARGGFGAVYRAWDPSLEREVAIKVLLDQRDEDELERFQREGQAATRIMHPNVLRVLGGGNAQGRPYLVMELAEGPTLAARIEREREGLLVAEAVDIVVALASGIEAAHRAGVLHRDLKPQNVLFQDGRPLLTDFGIARLADARSLTQTGELLGTPGYMAPEQVEGDRTRLGPPTDVYGLGAILYASLTGRAPFEGGTLLATLDQVLRSSPEPPSAHREEVDRQLDAICLRALARAPGERYASAAEFAAALEAWATPAAPKEVGGGAALPIAVLLFLLAGGLGAGAWSLSSPPREEPPSATRSPTPAPSLSPSLSPSAKTPRPLPSVPSLEPSEEAARLLVEGRAAVERDLDEAMRLLDRAARDPSVLPAARVEQAFVQVKRRRVRAATDYLIATKGARATRSGAARAHYVSGRILYEKGNRERALAAFEKAVRTERLAPYLAWLGIASPAKARAGLLAEAREINAEDPAVLYLEFLSDSSYTTSPAAASKLLARFQAALEKAPESPYLAFYAPRLHWHSGDAKGALDASRSAVEAWPDYPNPYREAGWILAESSHQVPPNKQTSMLKGAMLVFEKGLSRFPTSVSLSRERAWLYLRMGQWRAAVEAHEELLELEKSNPSAWSLHNTYLVVKQYLLNAANSRDLQGLEEPERVEALGRSVLDRMAAIGYLRTRAYGKTPEVEAVTRTDLRLLLGRVLGIQRRWKEAAQIMGPAIAASPRQSSATYLHYLNREEEVLYSLRPQRPLEEVSKEWDALFLSGHRAGIAEALEARATRGLPLPSLEFLDRVKHMEQVALRLQLCRSFAADPYDLKREVLIRQRILEADPGNLLGWHALLQLLLRHKKTVTALSAIRAAPRAIAEDPLILALTGEILSENALVTGENAKEHFDRAEAAFTRAFQLEPRFRGLGRAFLEHALRQGRPTRARKILNGIRGGLLPDERARFEGEILRLETETR